MRKVILHYHFFKNAGTTVERILENTFGEGWGAIDGNNPSGHVSPEELLGFVQSHPDLHAVSSHQALMPPPETEGLEMVPLLLLRHPIDRARSVYSFESKQAAGTPGAEFAANHSFPEYVRWRLDNRVNGVIHNFQITWLLRRPWRMRPLLHKHTYREVMTLLDSLPCFGMVERFRKSMQLFNRVHQDGFELEGINIAPQNVTRERRTTLQERLGMIREELGDKLMDELRERNAYDLAMYRDAMILFEKRCEQWLDEAPGAEPARAGGQGGGR